MGLDFSSRVYTQGVKNLNDALSFFNVAEGTLSNLSGIVARLKELAEQAANGSYSLVQRQALNGEARKLIDEYNRQIASTTFNGLHQLDRSLTSVTLQAGYGDASSLNLALTGQLSAAAGDGTFGKLGDLSASYFPYQTAIGDFNRDGKLDLAVASSGDYSVSIYTGNGSGGFSWSTNIEFGGGSGAPTSVIAADFTGDGIVDLAVGDSASAFYQITILAGNGSGSFSAASTTGSMVSPAYVGGELIAGDFDGDGKMDLVSSASGTLNVYRGNGLGGLSLATTLVDASEAVSGDFNGDGKLDIASSGGRVYLGNGAFGFASAITFSPGAGITSISSGDFNLDGLSDVVITNSGTADTVTVLIGSGGGSLAASVSYSVGNNPSAATIGDFNGDGISDLATANYMSGNVSILLGTGTGGFSAAVSVSAGTGAFSAISGDVNGDGVLDLLVTNNAFGGSISVLRGNSRQTTNVAYLNIASRQGALSALGALEAIQNRVELELGAIGAHQSRSAAALAVLNASADNYTAARGRIVDADIAEESAALIRNQILQDTGSAVLALANQQPALVLKLLAT